MAWFYPPPPPSQGPVNSTLPIPHDPIGNQGDQPPRRQVANAIAAVAMVAAWTPPWTMPPSSPAFAQNLPAPPVAAVPYVRPQAHIYRASDEPFELELVTTWTIAPENPDQPPRQSALSATSTSIIWQAWQPTPPPAQLARSAAWNVAPANPKTKFPDAILAAWLPPDPMPTQRIKSVAPTFPSPISQPVPQGPITPTEYAQIVASWPTTTGPILPYPLATPVKIAPLTLPRGDQPPPVAPLSAQKMAQIAGTWVQTWDAQCGPKNASWNVPPILVVLPWVAQPAAIRQSWEPPYIAPPRPVAIATLTLPRGDQPPPTAALSPQKTGQIVSTWVQTWNAQSGPKCAAWNIPPIPITARTPPPRHLWTAWEPAYVPVPRPVQNAAVIPSVIPPPPPPQEFGFGHRDGSSIDQGAGHGRSGPITRATGGRSG